MYRTYKKMRMLNVEKVVRIH